MVAGKYICCNVSEAFHLLIIAFVHRTFKSYIDESFSESWMCYAMLNECFHVEFDFSVDACNCNNLF